MKVLFIGGTGIISSACSQLAVETGIELYHFNRGISAGIRPISQVQHLHADIRNLDQTTKVIENLHFDAVVDWISFTPEHIEQNIRVFSEKTNQYIFISSASIYQTPPQTLPITEETLRENPFWEYSRNKIACEDILLDAYEHYNFPITIVRPSHTYDKTLLPIEGGYTVIDRMRHNKPIIVHGDGTSIWTLTHHKDFAKGLIGLIGNKQAIGESFHITSDEWLSWNTIYEMLGEAFGCTPHIVHVPSDIIAQYHSEIGDSLLGDKAHSMIFDNSKIKRVVPNFRCSIPFAEGVQEIAKWYTEHTHAQQVDASLSKIFDAIIQNYCNT